MSSRRREDALFGLAAIVPALALGVLAAWLQTGAPLPDDVDAILDFANQSAEAQGLVERSKLLLAPHVDHRIFATRAAASLQLATSGRLDLRVLSMLGVGALWCVGLLLVALRTRRELSFPLVLAPVAWLLFQPQPFDALISPTMGANLLVLPFAIGTLLALRAGSGSGFALAVVCAAMATFSQGNGVLVWPAALLALLLSGRRRTAMVWLGVSVVGAFGYFASTTTSRAVPLALDLADPLGIAGYGLAFLGSSLGQGSALWSALAGAGLLVFFAACGVRGLPRHNPWLWGALAFVLLSIAANALGRAELGADYAAAQPRYRVYSALALALGSLLALDRFAVRGTDRPIAALLLASMAFGVASYVGSLPPALGLSERAARGTALWSVTGEWPAHPRPAHAAAVLARSRALGLFGVEQGGLARHLDRVEARVLPEPSDRVRASVTRSEAGEAFRLIEGRFDPAGFDPARLRISLVLDGEIIVSARHRPLRRIGTGGAQMRAFRSLLPLAIASSAPRRVGLWLSDGVSEAYTSQLGGEGLAASADCPRCNLVLVTFDALRADHLGSIDPKARAMSPELDAFARESVVFTRALSQSASTVVSLPSLFTSRFPILDAVYAPLGLRPGVRTLTHQLAEGGYATAAVVGWRYAGSLAGLDAGFERFIEVGEEIESAAETLKKAEALLADLPEPFFLWIHLRPPHRPYRIAERSFRAFYDAAGVPPGPTLHSHRLAPVRAHLTDHEPFTPYDYFGRRRSEALSPAMVRQIRALYAGSVLEADAAFGGWLRSLEAKGLDRRSVIAVAADHGEALGEHHLFGHNRLHYEALHTPILLRVPGVAPAVESRPVMNVDLYPTLLNRVGVAFEGPIRGHDLLGPAPADAYQLAEYEHWRSLVIGNEQLILKATGPELYPVPGTDARPTPGSGARLVERARALRPLDAAQAEPLTDDSATFEALRALGYIE